MKSSLFFFNEPPVDEDERWHLISHMTDGKLLITVAKLVVDNRIPRAPAIFAVAAIAANALNDLGNAMVEQSVLTQEAADAELDLAIDMLGDHMRQYVKWIRANEGIAEAADEAERYRGKGGKPQ